MADAFVNSSAPDRNFGLEVELQVDGEPSVKISYLRFDLSSLAGENVSRAKLRVRIVKSSGANSSATQTVRLADDSKWDATEITYYNRPELSPHWNNRQW